jgi:predicted ATPase
VPRTLRKGLQTAMYLSNFKISGFRSYSTTQELHLEQDLTILAGRNNVGKSALLWGVFLPGRPHFSSQVRGVDINCRLEYTWALSHSDLTEALSEAGIELLMKHVNAAATYQLHAAFACRPSVETFPALDYQQGPFFDFKDWYLTDANLIDSTLRINVFQRTGVTPASPAWWVGSESLNGPTHQGTQAILNQLYKLISSFFTKQFYIYPNRHGAQRMDFIPTTALAPAGDNLTTVVATLFQNYYDTTFLKLEEFMRSAFPDIKRIRAPVEPNTQPDKPPRTEVYLHYGPPGSIGVPLEDCGTGIEQMLMLATAIFTSEEPRLFLIDEPHAFLHPSAERSLLGLLQKHAKHQYLVATHSPAFLKAFSLTHTVLITRDSEGSHINDVQQIAQILDEFEITAADLWSAEAIVWVEGPSDVPLMVDIIASLDELKQISCQVKEMPDVIRAGSTSHKNARQAMIVFESVREAISPVKVQPLFVFDGDEKKEDLKESIQAATGGKARFLPVRELENLFLSAYLIHPILAQACNDTCTPPTVEEIERDIKAMVEQVDERRFYLQDPKKPDINKIVGSHVLEELWLKWAQTEYHKVRDGRKLTKAMIEHEPERLEPLREFLRDLAGWVLKIRQNAGAT